MKNKWIAMGISVIATLMLAACQPGTDTATEQPNEAPTQGIIEPTTEPTEDTSEGGTVLSVDGYEIQVDTASLSKEYIGGYVVGAASGENLLIVRIKILSGESMLSVMGWALTADADDIKGIKSNTSEVTTSADMKTAVGTWVFGVPETATTFVLNLQDGQTIDISSIVTPLH